MDEYLVNTIEYKDHTIKIYQDQDPLNPREWDNLGTMYCFNNKYDLGDKHDFKSGDFDGWKGVHSYLTKELKNCILYPLYLYDHSGISMRTYPHGQHAAWDCGKVGYIGVTKEKIHEEYGKAGNKEIELAKKCLLQEVETYNKYLTGQVYGYVIEGLPDEEIDSCWGFYGYDHIIQEAKETVDFFVKQAAEKAWLSHQELELSIT